MKYLKFNHENFCFESAQNKIVFFYKIVIQIQVEP